jgi:hypothetical protein
MTWKSWKMTRTVKMVPKFEQFGKFSLNFQTMEDDLQMMEDDLKIMEDDLAIMEEDLEIIEND